MKPLLAITVFSFAFILSSAQAETAHAQQAGAPAEHQHQVHAAASTPAPGKRWATDAPLREGMGRIRTVVDGLSPDAKGRLGAAQANQAAASIQKDVNFLIANCKLQPEADAALHQIIAKLLQGAQAIKADPSDAKGMELLHTALADYERSFDEGAKAKAG